MALAFAHQAEPRRRLPGDSRHVPSLRPFLDQFAWWRVAGWLRKRHKGLNWETVHRRLLPGWQIRDGSTEMFRPAAVSVTRYRYRAARIPTPWAGVPARTA
jgi:RNA-directed DNA polymerase